jgi:hypothetical protein
MGFRVALKRKVKELPRTTKQQILDLVHSGKTVGEVCNTTNLELLVVSGVIHENIERISVLRKLAK